MSGIPHSSGTHQLPINLNNVQGKLNCDELTVTGAITGSHNVLGADKNQGELHYDGSIFYIKWSGVHRVGTINTTNGSTSIHIGTTSPHNLSQVDTVHISPVPFNGEVITEVSGIPVSEIVGTHVITAVQTTTSFTIQTTTPATSTGTVTNAVPLVRVDRYRYTDMNSHSYWLDSTTLPTPAHINTELFY